jgi:hypothetical protein
MWQLIKRKNIILSWLSWHYVVAMKELLIMCKDFFLFTSYYFSIPFLLRTLFYPWRKQKIYREKGFNIASFFDALLFNAFSRFMGALIRTVVILIGVVAQIITVFVSFLIILFWILLPVAVALSLPIYIWLILT